MIEFCSLNFNLLFMFMVSHSELILLGKELVLMLHTSENTSKL